MDPAADRAVSVLPEVSLPDRYEAIRRIARGGMASVWCALDRTLDRHVAIKLLAEPYAGDELAGRRFTREARAAARLSGHPHVVTIFDVGRTLPSDDAPRGRPFIVMEHLAGGTVADALRTGELDQPIVLEWLREAAAGLDYAHRRGVIHRDVKLSNFLLDCHRVLHVADFGIAQLGTEDTLSATGQLVGTAAYLAPERALGLPATASSDRYSLAVAAFELLVGERPFTATHFAAQARQHLEDPPPRASERKRGLPASLDAVLARGMAKHQDDRFDTAEELVDAIERALTAGRPKRLAAPRQPSPPVALPLPPNRRGRSRAAAASALGGALLCAAVASVSLAGALHAPKGHSAAVKTQAHVTPHVARDRGAATDRTTSTSSAATTTPPPANGIATATALEAQGHQLMVAGNYQAAIPVLRQAVAGAPHSSLTYAYALYDLGRSLRLAGDAKDAVPILRERLQIPNQTAVVSEELRLALAALGQGQAKP